MPFGAVAAVASALSAAFLALDWKTWLSDIAHYISSPASIPFPLGAIPVVLGLILVIVLFLRNAGSAAGRAMELGSSSSFREVPIPPEQREEILRPVDGREGGIRIWRKDGVSTVTEAVIPAAPSLTPPAPTPFIRNMLAAFMLLVVTMMLFRHPLFYFYDRVVLYASLIIYWPLSPPTALATLSVTHTVPDYILIVYLSFLVAFLLASGVITSERFPRRTVRGAIAIVLAYPVLAALSDAFFFSSVDPFSRSAVLVIRGIIGGVFVGGLVLWTTEQPRPVRVAPQRPAEVGVVAVFFLSVAASLVLALGLLYLLFRYVGIGHHLLPIGVLLLLPQVALTIWALIGRGAYHYYARQRPVPPVTVYHPPVSVVIPAFNEAAGIEETIRAVDVAAAKYPGVTEIIVGNDGSSDQTLSVAIRAILELKHAKGAVVDLPHGGKAHVLNSILRVATGDIVIRIDADTRLSAEWGFAAMIPHFADPNIGGVQGLILPLQQTGWTRRLRILEIAWNHLFLRPATMGLRATQVVDGAFSAFRRSDLLAVGGWVEWNGEDTEITLRLQRLGYRMRLETEAAAFEDVPENYAKLERQRIRWNRGGIYARYRHLYSSLSGPWAYGGLASLYWLALFVRSGLRSGLYVYVVLVAVFIPTLFHLAVILAILLIPRTIIISVLLTRYHRARWIPWALAWPAFSVVKQHFAVKAWGTMFPGEATEYA